MSVSNNDIPRLVYAGEEKAIRVIAAGGAFSQEVEKNIVSLNTNHQKVLVLFEGRGTVFNIKIGD